MRLEFLPQIAAVAGQVASIVGVCVLIIKPLRDKIFGLLYITNGLECMLRSDILRTYYQNREQETVRQFEMENLHKTYAAYKALGGNSFADDLYNKL